MGRTDFSGQSLYPAHDRLRQRVAAARIAALSATQAAEWLCSDGHPHARPEKFTLRRLATEVERRNPGNDWTGAEISLGIYELMHNGFLVVDNHWRLSVA